jgi:hypothetical protein
MSVDPSLAIITDLHVAHTRVSVVYNETLRSRQDRDVA